MKKEPSPLISVIVPIYKIEPYLEKCIISILEQKYHHLEIILVDDGSPDQCPAICDYYAKQDKRIKVIHKKNGGLVSARKAGLQMTTGELIGYVDGDDWIGRNFYQKLYEAYSASHADIVADGFSRDILDVSEKIVNNLPTGIYKDEALEKTIYHRMLCAGDYFYFGIYSYVWNKLFKRDVLYDSQMAVDDRIAVGEDLACTFPALLKAKNLHVIDACNYHYQQRAGSMLKTLDDFAVEEKRLDVLSSFLQTRFEQSGYKDILLPQLDRYMEGIRMIRSEYNCEIKKDCWYPFGQIDDDDRVAIYSAGTFGQNLFSRFIAKGSCRITGWYDKDDKQYQQQGFNVQPPSDINDADFDKIIIASLDERFIKKTKQELQLKRIKEAKIVAL